MDLTSVEISIALGLAFVIFLATSIVANHLWKPPYFLGALVTALFSASLGFFLEKTGVFPKKQGMALVVIMFAPLIYFTYFQLYRLIFKVWKGTEPYVSVKDGLRIGDRPTALLDSRNVYRDRRKFDETRKLMWADRFFGLFQYASTWLTIAILILLALIYDR